MLAFVIYFYVLYLCAVTSVVYAAAFIVYTVKHLPLFIFKFSYEFYRWNGGICKESGRPWQRGRFEGCFRGNTNLVLDAYGNHFWCKYFFILNHFRWGKYDV